MDPKWWKEAIMYQIYPRSFQDSNGDGIGDIQGIISRLDYLESLGIDILWLGPVYESPNKDNGYDISNYYKINPEFGTMDDFDQLLEGLHKRGIKLIMDLVVNHTSDEHPWFLESKKSKDNPYRDFYIWKKPSENRLPNNWMAWFGGEAWDLDEYTNEYYLHYFLKSQPDLNWENPKVRAEVYKNMMWWLDKGIDGFRMDVISLLSKQLHFPNSKSTNIHYLAEYHYANGPRIHEFLQEMNSEVLSKYDVMTVGEGPGITKELANLYIGKNRNELNMIFQLDAMILDHGPGGKMDVVPHKLSQLKKLMSDWNDALGDEGWNNIFLDNHDFPRMVSRWGNDSKYREESTKLLLTYLMTMRGTPCIYQGSEIGMTNVAFENKEDYRDIESVRYIEENGWNTETRKALHKQSRDNVRTPMQWSKEKNGGFTTSKPWIPLNPNYDEINVDIEERNENSILHFFRIIIKFRKEHKVLTYGDYKDLLPLDEELYIFSRSDAKESFIIVLNFSTKELSIEEYVNMSTLLISNYNTPHFRTLRAWEARVYRAQ